MDFTLKKYFSRFSFGAYATASFFICALSGLVLIIPYEVDSPYLSISNFLLNNPGAAFFRNLHYWSAQFFFIVTLLHIWDHLNKNSHKRIKTGVWLRLSFGVLILFLAMIGGFILKGDADSLQAWRILNSLTASLPFFGETLAYSLFGADNQNLSIPYIHHIATFTIILFIILFEHVRNIWPKSLPYIYTLVLLSGFSLFLNAPLHDNINPVLKGPWYFVGFQEILHWMSNPTLFIWIIIGIAAMLFLVKYLPAKAKKPLKIISYSFLFFYLIITIVAYFFRGEEWKWKSFEKDIHSISNEIKVYPVWNTVYNTELPTILNKKEGCVVCHSDFEGFSPAHNPEAIGCTSCHLGNPFTLNKKAAHRNMVNLPGNLSNAYLSCSSTQCHPIEHHHISNSLMSSLSGIVAVDKFVFGEIPGPDSLLHIKDLGFSMADKHMRDLCANCHLGNEKRESGPINQKSRGGGCLACHLNYNEKSVSSLKNYKIEKSKSDLKSFTHPSLSIQISNDHCFGCHSRSGRISTNYEGWHETSLKAEKVTNSGQYRILEDKRVFEKKPADVHHSAGLVCIDCHTYSEVMGNGRQYLHKEEAVKISCEDCHTSQFTNTSTYSNLPAESKVVFKLRNQFEAESKIATTKIGNYPLLNVQNINIDSSYLKAKSDSKIHRLKEPAASCELKYGHSNLSCSSCHSIWAPQCIGCHNSFDKDSKGFDLLARKEITGEWKEHIGLFLSDEPTLGVRENDSIRSIVPAVPGMIMTIDKGSFVQKENNTTFLRLFAPSSPHTTQSKGRTCVSCHSNSLSLGYGRGKLEYVMEGKYGKWKFTPRFVKRKEDNLPEDAWIGFLSNKKSFPYSTRSDFRPFSLEEQKKILRIGACLSCHEEKSKIIQQSLNMPFEDYLKKISSKCILPNWN